MRRLTLGAAALWVALAGGLAAQDAGRIGEALAASCGVPLDPAREGVLAGIVSDSVSQVPLPGARVTLDLREPGDTLQRRFETETDMEGFYAFCKVPAGVRATLGAELRKRARPVVLTVEAGMLHVEPLLIPLSDPTETTGILLGRIVDAERRTPVAEAEVRLVELNQTTVSNARGYFTFGDQPWGVYTLEVSSLGYAPATTGVRVAGSLAQNLEVLLSPDALELEGITVTADARLGRHLEGMVRRMSFGAGDFITRDVLEVRPAAGIADILQEVPGMSVRRGLYGQLQMEVRGRSCVPDVWVDGALYIMDPSAGFDFFADELEAVEVYRGIQVPGEFLRPGRTAYPCATIVVWTRRGLVSRGGR